MRSLSVGAHLRAAACMMLLIGLLSPLLPSADAGEPTESPITRILSEADVEGNALQLVQPVALDDVTKAWVYDYPSREFVLISRDGGGDDVAGGEVIQVDLSDPASSDISDVYLAAIEAIPLSEGGDVEVLVVDDTGQVILADTLAGATAEEAQ